MEVLVVIPARGGSKRLPGKNVRPLAGRSLLAWTAEAVAAAGLAERAVLSTDDPAIAEEGRRCGLPVPFMRPAELATDNAPTVDTILHALEWCSAEQGRDPGAVLVLQPTSPLRGAGCIAAALELLDARQDVESIIAMTPLHLPPSALFLWGAEGHAQAVAADDRRPVYMPNGALYLTRTEALRTRRTLYADPVLPLAMDPRRGVDIDTEADWHLAEALLSAGLPPEPAETAGYAPVSSPEPAAR